MNMVVPHETNLASEVVVISHAAKALFHISQRQLRNRKRESVRSLRESEGIDNRLVVAGHAADESCIMVVHRALDQVDKD